MPIVAEMVSSSPITAAPNPFADLQPQQATTQQEFQGAAATVVAPVDAAAAFAAFQKTSTQSKHPAYEYLQDTRGLWNYSDLPLCCPQCEYPFNMKDHRRKLRWSSWLLIGLIVAFSPVLGLFVRGILLWLLVAVLIFPVLLLAKKVSYRCYRCGWTKKFIVRSGVR